MECIYVSGIDAGFAAPPSSFSSSHLFGIKIKTKGYCFIDEARKMASTLISGQMKMIFEIGTTMPANEVSMFLKRDTRHDIRITCLLSSHANFDSLSQMFNLSDYLLSPIEQTLNAINQCGNGHNSNTPQ